MSQAYQPPPSGSGSGNQSSGAVAFEDTTKPVAYLCGDCDAKVILRRGDQIMCRECGHRVLYKERTNRMVQFEAR
ncbi:DNA-directed RNA polymerase core subunit rpc10 [Botryosphaeria dothidea]